MMNRRSFLFAVAGLVASRAALSAEDVKLTKDTVFILDGKTVTKQAFFDSECEIIEIEVRDGKVIKLVGQSKEVPT